MRTLPPPSRLAPHLALVALSARSLVECVHADGYPTVALDVFADLDTCRLARRCQRLGGGGLAMDRDALLGALADLRARGDVAGWVAGSGFEARLELLAEAAAVLPLLGNAPETVRTVRDPAAFFAVLDTLGIAHPAVSFAAPGDPNAWLVKDAHACGGWHIRPASAALPGGLEAGRAGGGRYFQRVVAGTPWSCLFLAAGADVRMVGFSRQIVRALGARPYVYRGGIGPLSPPPAVQAALGAAALGLTRAFGLVGLNGIDFVLDAGERPWVLELNPRPTAATQLFTAGGLMRAHVEACAGRVAAWSPPGAAVRGFETVFARRAGQVDASVSAWMEGQGWCCDIPQPGTRHAWGDPLCTVRAEGESEQVVQQRLAERRRAVLSLLQSRLGNALACR